MPDKRVGEKKLGRIAMRSCKETKINMSRNLTDVTATILYFLFTRFYAFAPPVTV